MCWWDHACYMHVFHMYRACHCYTGHVTGATWKWFAGSWPKVQRSISRTEISRPHCIMVSNHYIVQWILQAKDTIGPAILSLGLSFIGGQKCTVKPPTKDTPKEDKPPNRGQAETTPVYTLYRKSPPKDDNLSTKDKTAGPKGVLI